MLPGELAKHAVSEGTKAVTKFELFLNQYDIIYRVLFVLV